MDKEKPEVQLPDSLRCCQDRDMPGGYCGGGDGCDRSTLQYFTMRGVIGRKVTDALVDTADAITDPSRDARQKRVGELLETGQVRITYVTPE